MDMMLSTKTLGTEPGCVVIGIGAVMFDREGTGKEAQDPDNQLYIPISQFDSMAVGLQSSMETLRFWKKQPAWKILESDFSSSEHSVKGACEGLTAFVEKHKPRKVWSNSPRFHVSIMQALYERVGLPWPVHYRDEMDFRTVVELAYGDRHKRPAGIPLHSMPKHHPLGDAITQAQDLTAAIKVLDASPAQLLLDQEWLMLDIETLGRKPGDQIMTIGACMFSPRERAESMYQPHRHFYRAISSFDSSNAGFLVDPDTLRWWKAEPIWRAILEEANNSPVGVKLACKAFAQFVETNKPHKVLANSPGFDVAITKFAFERVGIPFPLSYDQELDYRTIMELAYPVRESRPERMIKDEFMKHHALGDAIEQSLQTVSALSALGVVPSQSALVAKAMSAARAINEVNAVVEAEAEVRPAKPKRKAPAR